MPKTVQNWATSVNRGDTRGPRALHAGFDSKPLEGPAFHLQDELRGAFALDGVLVMGLHDGAIQDLFVGSHVGDIEVKEAILHPKALRGRFLEQEQHALVIRNVARRQKHHAFHPFAKRVHDPDLDGLGTNLHGGLLKVRKLIQPARVVLPRNRSDLSPHEAGH